MRRGFTLLMSWQAVNSLCIRPISHRRRSWGGAKLESRGSVVTWYIPLADPGGLGVRASFSPKKIMQFSGNFEQSFGSGPLLGSKLYWAPLTKKLDPPLIPVPGVIISETETEKSCRLVGLIRTSNTKYRWILANSKFKYRVIFFGIHRILN